MEAQREIGKGEYTFTGGRGGTVMDYIMGEGEVRDRVIEIRIGERGIKGSTQTTTPWKYV